MWAWLLVLTAEIWAKWNNVRCISTSGWILTYCFEEDCGQHSGWSSADSIRAWLRRWLKPFWTRFAEVLPVKWHGWWLIPGVSQQHCRVCVCVCVCVVGHVCREGSLRNGNRNQHLTQRLLSSSSASLLSHACASFSCYFEGVASPGLTCLSSSFLSVAT